MNQFAGKTFPLGRIHLERIHSTFQSHTESVHNIVKPHTTEVACFLLPALRRVPFKGFGLPLHHTAKAQHHAAAAASAALRLISVDKVQVLLLLAEGTSASSRCFAVAGKGFMSSRIKYRAPIL